MEGQETYLRVGIDGSSAVSGGRVVQRSLDDISGSADKAGSHLLKMKEILFGIAGAGLGVYGVSTAIQAIGNYAKDSLNYLGKIETATLGIASSFLVSGSYIDRTTGKALEGSIALKAAQQESAKVIEQLKVANLETIATLDELVVAYQTTLPVAMAKGFNKQQVMEYTKAMTQAAGAVGLPFNQMAEETRSMLVEGAINPRNSRIATVLGLRNEDLAKYKNDADGLFKYLMERLNGFTVAGKASMETWAGLWSNFKDTTQRISGEMFTPMFDKIKAQLSSFMKGAIVIDVDVNGEATSRLSANIMKAVDAVKLLASVTVEAGKAAIVYTAIYKGFPAAVALYEWINAKKMMLFAEIELQSAESRGSAVRLGSVTAIRMKTGAETLAARQALLAANANIHSARTQIQQSMTIEQTVLANRALVIAQKERIVAQNQLNLAIETGDAAMKKATATMSLLSTVMNVAMAAWIGWEIGSWFSDNFEVVRKAGVSMVYTLVFAFEYLTWSAKIVAAGIGDIFHLGFTNARAGVKAEAEAWFVEFRNNFAEQLDDVKKGGVGDPKAKKAADPKMDVDYAARKKEEEMKNAASNQAAHFKNMLDAQKQYNENKLNLAKAVADQEMSIAKFQYDTGISTTLDYFAKRKAIEEQEANATVARARQNLNDINSTIAEMQSTSASSPKDEQKVAREVEKMTNDRMKAEGELAVAIVKRATVSIDANQRDAIEMKKLQESFIDYSIARLEAEGKLIEAIDKKIAKERESYEFQRLLRDAEAEMANNPPQVGRANPFSGSGQAVSDKTFMQDAERLAKQRTLNDAVAEYNTELLKSTEIKLQGIGYDSETISLMTQQQSQQNAINALKGKIAIEVDVETKAIMQLQLENLEAQNEYLNEHYNIKLEIAQINRTLSAGEVALRILEANGIQGLESYKAKLQDIVLVEKYRAVQGELLGKIKKAENDGDLQTVNMLKEALGLLESNYEMRNSSVEAMERLKQSLGIANNIQKEINKGVKEETDLRKSLSEATTLQEAMNAPFKLGEISKVFNMSTGLPVGDKSSATNVAADNYEKDMRDAVKEFKDNLKQISDSISENLKSVYSALASSGKSLVENLLSAAKNLKNAQYDLLVGSDSTLSPLDKYTTTGATFEKSVNTAISTGDPELLNRLPELAKTFLDSSKAFNSSNAQYASDFAKVQNLLGIASESATSKAITIDPLVGLAERQVELLKQLNDAFENNGDVVGLTKAVADGNEQLLTAQSKAQADMTSSTTNSLSAVVAAIGTNTNVTFDAQKITSAISVSTNANVGTTVQESVKQITAATTADAYNRMWLNNVYNQTGQVSSMTGYVSSSVTALTNNNASWQSANLEANRGVKNNTQYNGTSVARFNAIKAERTTYGYFTHPQTGAQTILSNYTSYEYYAKGGKYGGGSAMMGELGPELVDSSPGYVYRADQTKALFEMAERGVKGGNSEETVSELKETNRHLAAQVKVLQAGFSRLILVNENQDKRMQGIENKTKLQAAA